MRFSSIKPWMFGITVLPYGMVAAFAQTLMGHKLTEAKVSIDNIGWYSVLTGIPVFAQFLYTPLTDLKLNQHTWLFIGSLVSALAIGASVFVPLPSYLNLYLLLIFIAQLGCAIVASCNAGLMARLLPTELQHKAGGWHSLGNIGGTGIIIGIMTILSGYISLKTLSVTYGLFAILPGLFVFLIPKSTIKPQIPQNLPANGDVPLKIQTITTSAHWKESIVSLWKALKTHAGWTGILICLAPAGSAALTINGFSSLSEKYFHVSSITFGLSHGFIAGIASSIGALVCSHLNHQFSRRKLYFSSGILSGIVSVGIIFFPFTPITYAIGVGLYSLVAGFSTSAFCGFVLEIIRKEKVPVATYYTLFTSAANVAVAYVVVINSYMAQSHGAKGMFLSDAILNITGVLVLFLLFRFFFKKPTHQQNLTSENVLGDNSHE